MFRRRCNLGFPRKVVANYLLFCMIAVSWLTVGVVITSHTVLSSRATNACLSRLGRAAAAIEIEYLRHGKDNLATLLERTRSEASLTYCAVVSDEGTYLAHTKAELTGTPADLPTGKSLRWGDVTGTRFVDEHGTVLREYRVGLVADGASFGSLHIAVVEPNLWTTLTEAARIAPVAVLIPLLMVGVGAVVLSRLAKPMAGVDAQLQRIALLSPGSVPDLEPLPPRDTTSLGWNLVVDAVQRQQLDSGKDGLDKRLADAIAARKEEGLADILQSLQDGVALTDIEGRITFANRAIAVLLGDHQEESGLQGSNLKACLLAESPQLEESPLFDPSTRHRTAVSELQRHEGDSDRVIRVARQPLKSDRMKGQVWSLRDVTQQKLADKMREQFVDTVTHELRTPLSNIKAYAETLATSDSVDVENQKEFCNIINSEVTRLARFVDDLLSISSMEVGSLAAERQKVETTRLFDEVLAKVQPLMQAKDLKFETRLPAKMVDLHLDKDKIVAVLVNLLGNAAKYTPRSGHVALKVQIDETQLQIAVVDSGIGIAAGEIPLVFDKFFRSTDTRVQTVTGTGLGLSLAREVVRMHGGDITVESQLDHGSTFYCDNSPGIGVPAMRVEFQGAVSVVKADVPLNQENAETLSKLILTERAEGIPMVVLDMSDVSLIDSAGLNALLDIQDALQDRGGTLKLAAVSPLCMEILRITEVQDHFEHFRDVKAAVGSFVQ